MTLKLRLWTASWGGVKGVVGWHKLYGEGQVVLQAMREM
jgi:hypothetical protein